MFHDGIPFSSFQAYCFTVRASVCIAHLQFYYTTRTSKLQAFFYRRCRDFFYKRLPLPRALLIRPAQKSAASRALPTRRSAQEARRISGAQESIFYRKPPFCKPSLTKMAVLSFLFFVLPCRIRARRIVRSYRDHSLICSITNASRVSPSLMSLNFSMPTPHS